SRPDRHTDSNTDRTASSLELLLGAKHDFSTRLAVHAGFGTKLIDGASSPDWRIYTGVNYALGPLFAKDRLHMQSVSGEDGDRLIVQNVNFEFDSDQMTPESEVLLDEVAVYLRSGTNWRKLVIEGHTDSVGSEKYNMELSQRRANAIRLFLVKRYKFDPDK